MLCFESDTGCQVFDNAEYWRLKQDVCAESFGCAERPFAGTISRNNQTISQAGREFTCHEEIAPRDEYRITGPGFSMKFLTTIAVVACLSAGGASAEASMAFCFPGPFFGGWGYAYAPAPAPFYAARPVSYGYAPSYYSGYYGSSNYGCSTCVGGGCSVGCNTGCSTGCFTGCGTTGCSGDCGVVNSEKVPGPVKDPGFQRGTGERRREDESWRSQDDDGDRGYDDSSRSPLTDDDETFGDSADDKPDFLRNRDRRGLGSGSSGVDREESDSFRDSSSEPDPFGDLPPRDDEPGAFDSGTFDDSELERRNRIPMSEPAEEPVRDDGDSSDSDILVPAGADPEAAILSKGLLTASQVRTTSAGTHRRLAGRSDGHQPRSVRRWSSRDNKRKNETPRWIGVPAVDGRVRI